MLKNLYDSLARTPGVSARKVAKLKEYGLSLGEIQRRFGKPQGKASADPFLSPSCPDYPEKLRELKDPPLRLFHRGRHLADIKGLPTVGIVGSRKASHFGLNLAKQLGALLAARGVVVVSGLALGIDAACHQGAVAEMSLNPKAAPPVAVLGQGWGQIYPSANRGLARQVEESGILLTEYHRGTRANKWTFPARNRIIAALSDHLVVVEAGARSGSLYTAEFALDLGRRVWVVPRAPGRSNSAGVLALLRDGVEVVTDLLEFCETVAPSKRVPELGTDPQARLSPESKSLLLALAKADGDVELILPELNWSAQELAARLVELEIDGLIQRSYDGCWNILCWQTLRQLE